MANIRLSEEEKKINVKLSLKKKYVDELKSKNVNMSKLFEEKVIEYLKK